MSEPDAMPPRNDIELIGIHWERIQLLVTFRTDHEPALAALHATLRRIGGDESLAALPPIRPPSAPDERSFRFNIFQGPGQMPIEPGRWEVVVNGPAGEPRSLALEAQLAASADRAFGYYNGVYRVAFVVIDGRLILEVVNTPKEEHRGGLRRRWRRFGRSARLAGFRASVAILHRLPRRGRLVVFSSDNQAELRGNLKLVHDRMVKRGLDRQVRLRSILRPSIRTTRGPLERLRLVWLLARADVLVVDDYQPALEQIKQRPDQRIIQLWHAWGAFKTVGYSRIGKPGGSGVYSVIHRNYTYATASSEHEVPFYAEAFGIPEERVIPTGTPRMDEFLDPANQAQGREAALAAIPTARDHRVILLAPTFRGGDARSATYPIEAIDVRALYEVCVEQDAILVVKMHPFVSQRIAIPPGIADRIVEASDLPIDVNDLLLIADVLITDYSSLIFEFSALGRPMVFYAFDLDRYVATRDFYEPFESFAPGRIVRSVPDLVRTLRTGDFEQEKVAPFARRHLPAQPGSATDRIIDQLIMAP